MLGKFKAALALVLALTGSAVAADVPGVTATEIKIKGVFSFNGSASSIGLGGKGILAYVQSINDRGGINGRNVNYIAYDNAYSPPKAVEHVRKLVESDEVAFMFGKLGTPDNAASAKDLLAKHVPTIAIVTGSNKFTNVSDFAVQTGSSSARCSMSSLSDPVRSGEEKRQPSVRIFETEPLNPGGEKP